MPEPQTAAAVQSTDGPPNPHSASNNVEMTSLPTQPQQAATTEQPQQRQPYSSSPDATRAAALTAATLATKPKQNPSGSPTTQTQAPSDEEAPTAAAAAAAPGEKTDATPDLDVPGAWPAGAAAERIATEQLPSGPSVQITLLLTTGARHPFKIDPRYLRKRNVEADGMDPFNISVYALKELIWRDWRSEWEPRPTSPAYIRLIHFGRMLDDKSALRECRFNHDSANIVHMTVRPQEILDEEDHKAGKGGRDRSSGDRDARCRCVIL